MSSSTCRGFSSSARPRPQQQRQQQQHEQQQQHYKSNRVKSIVAVQSSKRDENVGLPTTTTTASDNCGVPSSNKRKYNNKNNNNRQQRGSNSLSNKKINNYSCGAGAAGGGGGDSFKVLNRALVSCETASDVLQVLQSTSGALTQPAGGGSLNMINFSTSLHRMARHSLQPYARAPLLKDPRFACFLAALAEAMTTSSSTFTYSSRELSNVVWALAKLKIVPPASALPLWIDLDTASHALREAARQVRMVVLESAQLRRDGQDVGHAPWLPFVSKLAGILVDYTRLQVPNVQGGFQQQEISNSLWAWATCERAEPQQFGASIQHLIQQQTSMTPQQRRPQEWSNSLWAVATAQIYNHHDELIEYVAHSMESDQAFIQSFKPQELSNSLWGVASILSNKPTPTTAAATTTLTPREERAALTIERIIARVAQQRAKEFKTQELSNTLWSLATLGFGLPTIDGGNAVAAANNYIVLPSHDLLNDRILMRQTVAALVQAAIQIAHKARSQELNNMAWALARLVTSSNTGAAGAGETNSAPWTLDNDPGIPKLLRAIGEQLSNRQRRVTTQDISTTLWSMATLGFKDEYLYRGMANRLAMGDTQARGRPQEWSNTLWAFATVEMSLQQNDQQDAFDTTLLSEPPRIQDPVVQCFDMAARHLMERPGDFKTQEIKDILWSFSKVGIRHPALFRFIAEHLVGATGNPDKDRARGLAEFSPQGAGNMAWAYARQAQLCEDVAARKKVITSSFVNGRLAVYTTAYFDWGESLIQRLFLAIAENGLRSHDQLRLLKPQDLSNTAWTFGIFGLRHEPFVEAAMTQLRARTNAFMKGQCNIMTTFKGQELGNLLWALATLNVQVPQDLLEQLAEYANKFLQVPKMKTRKTSLLLPSPNPKIISQHFKRQELANVAWSCAVFDHYPISLLSFLYAGLLGHRDTRDPFVMADIYGDGGLQSQEVMTLIYVQLGLLLSPLGAGGNGGSPRQTRRSGDDLLSLPPNFPGDWQNGRAATTSSSNSDNSRELTLDLNLTTSKVQQAVSAAFRRIGFDHCEEHVITMDDLANEYGLESMPRVPLQVLSIDIANVEKRIAIEVDGPPHYICRIDQGIENTGYAKISTRGKLEYQFGWNGERQCVNGPTALKLRLFQRLGWTVLSIPFWDWYAMDGDAEREESYCRQRLEDAITKSKGGPTTA